MKNIPNILTLFRLLCVPIFIVAYFSVSLRAALFIFLLASFTDFLDGYLARKYNVISAFGTVFDPLADKLLLLSALLCLYISHYIPLWIFVIILLKESFMIVMGIVFYFKPNQVVMPSNIFGKLATFLFSISISLLLLFPESYILQWFITFAVLLKLIALGSYVTHYMRTFKA